MNTRQLRTTHTFVELEVSPAAYDEIRSLLEAADYQHTFIDRRTVDMNQIAVTRGPENLPIDMILYCPSCGAQHVDEPQPEKSWTNPPHREHECQKCLFRWKPSNHPTNGVATIPEKHRYVDAGDGSGDVCKCGGAKISPEHY